MKFYQWTEVISRLYKMFIGIMSDKKDLRTFSVQRPFRIFLHENEQIKLNRRAPPNLAGPKSNYLLHDQRNLASQNAPQHTILKGLD